MSNQKQNTMNQKQLAETLRGLCSHTNKDVAKATGMSPNTVGTVMRGGGSVKSLLKVMAHLGLVVSKAPEKQNSNE